MKPATKKEVFAQARQVFTQLKPSPPAGFAHLDHGLSVTIAHDSGQLVISHASDLQRTINFCQSALDRREGKKTASINGVPIHYSPTLGQES